MKNEKGKTKKEKEKNLVDLYLGIHFTLSSNLSLLNHFSMFLANF